MGAQCLLQASFLSAEPLYFVVLSIVLAGIVPAASETLLLVAVFAALYVTLRFFGVLQFF